MSTQRPPTTDDALAEWATNASALLTASPTTWGTTLAFAATFATKTNAYLAAKVISDAPTSRGPHNTELKNEVKEELLVLGKQLVGIVRVQPGLTEAQRMAIDIPARKRPTRQPRPAVAPVGSVEGVNGLTVTVKFHAPDDLRRALADGAIGISVFSHVGPTAPVDIDQWKFETNTGKQLVDIAFPDAADFATVWFTAFYFNGSKESGYACQPFQTNLGKGSVSAAA